MIEPREQDQQIDVHEAARLYAQGLPYGEALRGAMEPEELVEELALEAARAERAGE